MFLFSFVCLSSVYSYFLGCFCRSVLKEHNLSFIDILKDDVERKIISLAIIGLRPILYVVFVFTSLSLDDVTLYCGIYQDILFSAVIFIWEICCVEHILFLCNTYVFSSRGTQLLCIMNSPKSFSWVFRPICLFFHLFTVS